MIRKIVLELDELDFDIIQDAITQRQLVRCDETHRTILPEFEGNFVGAVVAEICRSYVLCMEEPCADGGEPTEGGEQ